MALKDAIDKIVSYFDTDEVTDYEDAAKEEAKERPVKAQRPVQTPPPRQQRQPERSQATVPPRRQHVNSDLQETQVLRSLPLSRSQANQGPQQMNTTKTTIAIKYPKKYEDAQEIVELLTLLMVLARYLQATCKKLALQCICLRQLMSLLTSKRLGWHMAIKKLILTST